MTLAMRPKEPGSAPPILGGPKPGKVDWPEPWQEGVRVRLERSQNCMFTCGSACRYTAARQVP